MSELRLYRPSNATEGDWFMSEYCAKCALANFDDEDKACMINLRAMVYHVTDPEYPAEWQYSNAGVPQCTAFTKEPEPEARCDRTHDLFGGEA